MVVGGGGGQPSFLGPSPYFHFHEPPIVLLVFTLVSHNPGIPTTIKTMGVNITTIAGFNHRNWVNHYFNGGGSPGQISSVRMYYVDRLPSEKASF